MDSLKQRMARGDRLVGTFVKTASYEIIEVLAKSGLDFICLDAEHAPFDRARLDACLAIARALNLPALVRVPSAAPSDILSVLDCGATGIVVPHVATVDKAEAIVRAAHFGHGGRGYAGSTRFAGFATQKMPEILARGREETIVIAQIEEPEGVNAADDIAAIAGIDGLFVGPADLAVCYGETDMNAPVVRDAMKRTGRATQAHGKTLMTFAVAAHVAPELQEIGVSMFFVGSEHAFMLQGARRAVADFAP